MYADKGAENATGEASEKQYYVTDSHGNVVQLTDETGNVIKTYEYDSFGNEVKPDGKDDNPFRYCGEYYDKETEEIYLRARYYQPELGRFLTRDTYTGEEDEPESLHLYAYCENDGVNMTDPTGHDAVWLQQTDGARIKYEGNSVILLGKKIQIIPKIDIKFGHTAIAVQKDKKNWMYFSYSSATPSDVKANILGTNGKICVRYYKKKFAKKISKRKIIRETRREAKKASDGINYQKGIYFKGDFKKTYNFLKKQISSVPKYSLFGKAVKNYINDIPFVGSMSPTNYSDMGRNCMQLVAQALRKGKIEHSLSTGIYKALKKANKNPIPNLMYEIIRDWEKSELVFRAP